MTTPYYGMFSDRGNAKVHEIVVAAINEQMKWRDIELMLYALSKDREYAEAKDTGVREEVYFALRKTYSPVMEDYQEEL